LQQPLHIGEISQLHYKAINNRDFFVLIRFLPLFCYNYDDKAW